MNTRTLIAAALISFTASGAALAQIDAQPENYLGPQPVTSQLTRAEVKSQVLVAQAQGTLQIQPLNYPRQVATTGQRSRAEVMAEVRIQRVSDFAIYGDTSYPYESSFALAQGRDQQPKAVVAASTPQRAADKL